LAQLVGFDEVLDAADPVCIQGLVVDLLADAEDGVGGCIGPEAVRDSLLVVILGRLVGVRIQMVVLERAWDHMLLSIGVIPGVKTYSASEDMSEIRARNSAGGP
jgi:hypothetical protein